MPAPSVSVLVGVTVFCWLSKVLGVVASVASASVAFLSSVELATMVISDYVKQRFRILY